MPDATSEQDIAQQGDDGDRNKACGQSGQRDQQGVAKSVQVGAQQQTYNGGNRKSPKQRPVKEIGENVMVPEKALGVRMIILRQRVAIQRKQGDVEPGDHCLNGGIPVRNIFVTRIQMIRKYTADIVLYCAAYTTKAAAREAVLHKFRSAKCLIRTIEYCEYAILFFSRTAGHCNGTAEQQCAGRRGSGHKISEK